MLKELLEYKIKRGIVDRAPQIVYTIMSAATSVTAEINQDSSIIANLVSEMVAAVDMDTGKKMEKAGHVTSDADPKQDMAAMEQTDMEEVGEQTSDADPKQDMATMEQSDLSTASVGDTSSLETAKEETAEEQFERLLVQRKLSDMVDRVNGQLLHPLVGVVDDVKRLSHIIRLRFFDKGIREGRSWKEPAHGRFLGLTIVRTSTI